jgi:CheY-like chemotaxis protein
VLYGGNAMFGVINVVTQKPADDEGLHVVANGAAACEAAAATRYDLVFMDCHMPVVDGFAAARRIRAEAAWPGRWVPIVALTADALDTDRQRCFDCGMDDFMTKPVTIAMLASVIRRWSGRAQAPSPSV